VKNHVTAILKALKANNRTEAVLAALDLSSRGQTLLRPASFGAGRYGEVKARRQNRPPPCHIQGRAFEDLSNRAAEQLKIRVLDTLGVAIGALDACPVVTN